MVCLLLVASSALASDPTLEPNYGEATNGTFPSWEERVVAELTNRARVDPAAELAGCPAGNCPEATCYSARAPLPWSYDLNQSSRFHSLSMGKIPPQTNWPGHTTPCVLFSDIDSRFPGSSDGSFASSCSSTGTTAPGTRVNLFGAAYAGENIAGGYTTPHEAFYYAWLYEASPIATCGNSGSNGHRYNILTNNGPALGVGYAAVPESIYAFLWTQDFGGTGTVAKIPSGSHWTATNHLRTPTTGDTSVEFWANWYDPTLGEPTSATVVLDNVPTAMTRARGSITNGAYTVTIAGVPTTGCHTYSFQFIDAAANLVRYPTTGSLGFGTSCPDYQNGTAPAAPTGVTATATFTSGTQVQVTWNAVTGATSYEIDRRAPGGSFTQRGTSVTPSFTDSASNNTAYLYRVRAVNASGTSPDSASDLATTVPFTDDPLAAGVLIMATHLAELRTAVNAVRAQAGLSAATFTDAAVPGVLILAVHITELRARLDEATSVLGYATGGWTDTSLTGVDVKAIHFQEIRNRVK